MYRSKNQEISVEHKHQIWRQTQSSATDIIISLQIPNPSDLIKAQFLLLWIILKVCVTNSSYNYKYLKLY